MSNSVHCDKKREEEGGERVREEELGGGEKLMGRLVCTVINWRTVGNKGRLMECYCYYSISYHLSLHAHLIW